MEWRNRNIVINRVFAFRAAFRDIILITMLLSHLFQVKTFLDLQEKAAEIMAAIIIWESQLNNVEVQLDKINKREGSFIKENIEPRYKWEHPFPVIRFTFAKMHKI